MLPSRAWQQQKKKDNNLPACPHKTLCRGEGEQIRRTESIILLLSSNFVPFGEVCCLHIKTRSSYILHVGLFSSFSSFLLTARFFSPAFPALLVPSTLISACSCAAQLLTSISLRFPSDNVQQKNKKGVQRELQTLIAHFVLTSPPRDTKKSEGNRNMRDTCTRGLSPRSLDRVDVTHILSFADTRPTATGSINLF